MVTGYIGPGDRIRFSEWTLYRGESIPDIPEDQWTGTVLESWGMCREFFRVERDHDGRKVILFREQIPEVIQSRAGVPKNKFAAAAAGMIPATADTRKKSSRSG